ncbi:MAG: NADAR family protein [Afipia sp.]|nr:NADAR family protein [Afipia sp.]
MAASEDKLRTYLKNDVVFFRTTTGEFGPLSNMAPDYPIFVSGVRIPTAEALYQACRFPDDPDVQRLIIDQMSPMTAKMKSKKYRDRTREDWDEVRVNVMRWCLRVKLENNWERFGYVLDKTGDRPIVEESTKDEFWGAKPKEDGFLVGKNVLGRLLMELRERFRDVRDGRASELKYPKVSHFLLFSVPLEPSTKRADAYNEIQPFMFD